MTEEGRIPGKTQGPCVFQEVETPWKNIEKSLLFTPDPVGCLLFNKKMENGFIVFIAGRRSFFIQEIFCFPTEGPTFAWISEKGKSLHVLGSTSSAPSSGSVCLSSKSPILDCPWPRKEEDSTAQHCIAKPRIGLIGRRLMLIGRDGAERRGVRMERGRKRASARFSSSTQPCKDFSVPSELSTCASPSPAGVAITTLPCRWRKGVPR